MVRRTATSLPIKPPALLPDIVPACHDLIERLLQRLDVLEERVNLNGSVAIACKRRKKVATALRDQKARL